jgi:hypothetical protein
MLQLCSRYQLFDEMPRNLESVTDKRPVGGHGPSAAQPLGGRPDQRTPPGHPPPYPVPPGRAPGGAHMRAVAAVARRASPQRHARRVRATQRRRLQRAHSAVKKFINHPLMLRNPVALDDLRLLYSFFAEVEGHDADATVGIIWA